MAATKNIVVNLPGNRVLEAYDAEPATKEGAIMVITCEMPDDEGIYKVSFEITDPANGGKMAPMIGDDVIIEDGKVTMQLFQVEG